MLIHEKDSGVELTIRVVPRASRSEIVGEHDEALKVRIASPPVDGAANAELVKFLAKKLDISRSDITIESGASSKTKRVRIANISPSDLEHRISKLLSGF